MSTHNSLSSMAAMATATSAAASKHADTVKVYLCSKQWEIHLRKQNRDLLTQSPIEVLCTIYMDAMNDTTSKDKKVAAELLRAFFTTYMSRITDPNKDPVDQLFSVPKMMEQLEEFEGSVEKINMWISTNDYPNRWMAGVLNGLAGSGATPPQRGSDTRKCLMIHIASAMMNIIKQTRIT